MTSTFWLVWLKLSVRLAVKSTFADVSDTISVVTSSFEKMKSVVTSFTSASTSSLVAAGVLKYSVVVVGLLAGALMCTGSISTSVSVVSALFRA